MTQDTTVAPSPLPQEKKPGRMRRLWPVLLGALLTFVIVTLLTILLGFPTEALKERIVHEINATDGVQVSMDDLALLFPLGIGVSDVELRFADPAAPAVRIDEIRLRPRWGSLFGANPALNLSARLYRGTIQGTLARNGSVDLRLSDLQIQERIPQIEGLEVAGRISGAISSQGMPLAPNATLESNLTVDQLRALGMQSLTPGTENLSLGKLTAKLEGRSRSLKVESLTLEGNALEAGAEGSVFLGDSPQRTRLALQVKLRAQSELPAGLRDLFLFLPKADAQGFSQLRISGTLANPSVK